MGIEARMSPFALSIMQQKYAHTVGGRKESWREIAHRVATNVMSAAPVSKDLTREIERVIAERKFIPGGRYLYAAGRELHQVNNCLLLRAEDSREGWSDLLHKSAMALMTGAGIGIDYSTVRPRGSIIRKTGGIASGPVALMQMINEAGRHIRQGGSRRSAIWAGLNWAHQDALEFVRVKDWSNDVRALKERDFDFPATLDGTNISIGLDDEFFRAYQDASHPLHSRAYDVYRTVVKRMLKTAEPGFSVDVGGNAGETLRNAPVCAATMVLTETGYQPVDSIIDIPTTIWTGRQWAANVVFKQTAASARVVKVRMTGGRVIRCDASHPFLVERYVGAGDRRQLDAIVRIPAEELQAGDVLHVAMPSVEAPTAIDSDSYTLGYIYGDGSFPKAGNAEITFCTAESKDCVGVVRSASRLSSVTEIDGRGYTRAYFCVDEYFSHRQKSEFPSELYAASVASATSFLAGLFDADGNYEPTQQRIRLASKHEAFLRGVARLLEQLGILAGVSKAGHSTYGQAQTYQLVVQSDYSARFAELIPTIRLKPDLAGYKAYRRSLIKVLEVVEDGREAVYCADVKMPEHSFMAEGVIISNCTEVTSYDDSDVCNLGSINLARIESIEELRSIVELASVFLLAGTLYSDVPYERVAQVRSKNRRLGLGVMGVHEWLLRRGKRYEQDEELGKWLAVYAGSTEASRDWANSWSISAPTKTRAIAPTGTIGIIAETTTGLEPIFCVAYKRRYKDAERTAYQYVVDPTAQRLIDEGIAPDAIEDAYDLATDVERRVGFQAWLQQFVDHSISSTINLPSWGSELNNEGSVDGFGRMLMKYLPQLRGITCYPDGARSGQPLERVNYTEAAGAVGQVYYEAADVCDISKSGSCGS
jgi:ribonucleotide reductase alpha subunit